MRTFAFATVFALAVAAMTPASAAGFQAVPAGAWTRAAVERVLHVFAYGGRVSESQIQQWVMMGPSAAINQMLTFQPNNPYLAPPTDSINTFVTSLKQLQGLLGSDSPENPLCPSVRASFATYEPTAGANVAYSPSSVQRTWLAAAHLRGGNPFLHKVGLWLTNYLMATSSQFTKINLIRDHYDATIHLLMDGAPLWRVLAAGAASAAISWEYGLTTAAFDNSTETFTGGDDFGREFHQLFFKINGITDGAEYHEHVTIENTARALTGLGIDRNAPPTRAPLVGSQWWIAPIDFIDHTDGIGALILNETNHHREPLEILHTMIDGANAEEKLIELSRVAILHPESLDNLPIEIVRFFGDDNISPDKVSAIRETWRADVGNSNDLLQFLRQYAISTTFHNDSTYKYMTDFDQTIIQWNISNFDNSQFYTEYSVPLGQLNQTNTLPFQPVFRIFGHQTGLNAANDSNFFRLIYERSVTSNGPMGTFVTCTDSTGAPLWSAQRDWRQVIPKSPSGKYLVGDVTRWLWQRLTGDSGANYTILERAHLAAILATRTDLATLIDPSHPTAVYRASDLQTEPLASLIASLEGTELGLDSADDTTRAKANNNVAMAVNFIAATPFAFAIEGR